MKHENKNTVNQQLGKVIPTKSPKLVRFVTHLEPSEPTRAYVKDVPMKRADRRKAGIR